MPSNNHPPPDLQALADLAPQLARTFVSVAADIALVIGNDGVIEHVALGKDPIVGSSGQWLGRSWADTVTGSTRRKIELLLSEVQANGVTRRREVNHPAQPGLQVEDAQAPQVPGGFSAADEVPVAYSAIRLGPDGPIVAVGRDLRTVAAIQQRFVEATQAMERDYWAQRQAASQVRTLYQLATDAVLVVDAHTLKVVDANEAAHALLAPRLGSSLVGTELVASVVPAERAALMELLATARGSDQPRLMRLHAQPLLAGSSPRTGPRAALPMEVSVTPLRTAEAQLLMVQMRSASAQVDDAESSRLRSTWVDGLADALVVTDTGGRVLMCNPAFMQLCQAADGNTVHRRPLTALLGDPAHSLARALQTARSKGMAHIDSVFVGHREPFEAPAEPTTAGAAGQPTAHGATAAAPPPMLSVSAVLLSMADQECIGLRLRKLAAAPGALQAENPVERLASAIGQLADDMGLLPLPDLLQQATRLAERHLIGQALERCQGRQAETAQLLGIPLANLRQRMQHLGLTGTVSDLNHPATEDPRQH